MLSVLLAMNIQLTGLGLIVPNKPIIKIGNYTTSWLTYARRAKSCKTYATSKGYQYYLWTAEFQPNAMAITGTCTGIKKNR